MTAISNVWSSKTTGIKIKQGHILFFGNTEQGIHTTGHSRLAERKKERV